MKYRKGRVAALGLVVVAAYSASADAVMFGFTQLSNNAGVDLSSQFSVDVISAGSSQVDFTFRNSVGVPSSITDIYFDDGMLSGIASITGSSGVDFSEGATPPNLPGGNPIGFNADFSLDSNPPAPQNGLNAASESLTVRFDLGTGQSFQDAINAINAGSLRIGLHVQSIGEGEGSDAYILGGNGNGEVIPAPGAILLGVVGLGLLTGVRRREA